MPTKYYFTSNGSLREIRDDELMHWKYIKREKKNGKWVYTYDNDKFGIKNFIDTKITGKAYKQHQQEAYSKKLDVDNRAFTAQQSKIHAEQTSKMYSQDDPKVKQLKKEYKTLSEQSESLDKEAAEANANYQNKSVSGIVKTNYSNLKSNVKNLIETAKDKLGIDEREEYHKTKKSHEYVEENLKDAARREASDKKSKHSVYDHDAERMAPHTTEYWSERYYDTGKDYVSAKKEYMNTPLGKLDQALSDVKDWIDDLFDNKRKRS